FSCLRLVCGPCDFACGLLLRRRQDAADRSLKSLRQLGSDLSLRITRRESVPQRSLDAKVKGKILHGTERFVQDKDDSVPSERARGVAEFDQNIRIWCWTSTLVAVDARHVADESGRCCDLGEDRRSDVWRSGDPLRIAIDDRIDKYTVIVSDCLR